MPRWWTWFIAVVGSLTAVALVAVFLWARHMKAHATCECYDTKEHTFRRLPQWCPPLRPGTLWQCSAVLAGEF